MTLLSSSDHSDIVTLGDLKDDEHADVEEEAATNEEFYLGTSCSSQYAFTAAEAGTTQSPDVTVNTDKFDTSTQNISSSACFSTSPKQV